MMHAPRVYALLRFQLTVRKSSDRVAIPSRVLSVHHIFAKLHTFDYGLDPRVIAAVGGAVITMSCMSNRLVNSLIGRTKMYISHHDDYPASPATSFISPRPPHLRSEHLQPPVPSQTPRQRCKQLPINMAEHRKGASFPSLTQSGVSGLGGM
jgi:hypothetical protein